MKGLLDSNVPMYAAGREHPAKARCLALLQRVAAGELDVVADVEVFQEILHRYSALRILNQGCRLFDHLARVVPVVLPVDMEDMTAARRVLEEYPAITARDAIHVAVMRRHGISTIYSFDTHFDMVRGIRRIEP